MEMYNATLSLSFDGTAAIALFSALIPLCLFGIAANTLTVVVISRSDRLRQSIFNYFLLSLAVSDLLSILISPLYLYRRTWGLDRWVISSFLCKFYWSTELWTSYVTSIQIFLFVLLRYVFVRSTSQHIKTRIVHVKIVITVVWIVTFFVGFVPFMLMFDAKQRDRSSGDVDSKWPSCHLDVDWLNEFVSYTVATYSLFFYIPIIFIVFISIAVIYKIYQKRKIRRIRISLSPGSISKEISEEIKRQRDEVKIVFQLLLIVSSFLLGYIPHTAYQFYTTTRIPTNDVDEAFDWWFGVAEHICLRLSECLNPIFYNIASRKMRKETIGFLRKAFCFICKPSGSTLPVRASSVTETPHRSSRIPMP
ncbi:unnamed protein product [Clavelina lepadiformis]|uniref:G-protein coupled receptors family 1 profile domain-containing protein n=1 Tax=Clavelina lepadiformis TaxID=159417 RepID=A0ABP0F831_CLALP